MRKKIIIALAIIVVVAGAELGREHLMYVLASRRLEQGYWRIRRGMTKEEVTGALREPQSRRMEDSREEWIWDARAHQGWLIKRTFDSDRNHYRLIVHFDQEGRVEDFYSAIE